MKPLASAYLIGSSHAGVVETVFGRIRAATRTSPRVAISVAGWEAPRGAAQVAAFIRSHIPDAAVELFSVVGERDAQPAGEARRVVDSADIIFLGGGDPVLSVRRLCSAGADLWLQTARARGALSVGMSAGSIALGAFWASWPDDDPDGTPTLVRCLGVVPDLVVDCHAEADRWAELHVVRRLALTAHPAASIRFAGIGHDAALLVGPTGSLEWVGPSLLL